MRFEIVTKVVLRPINTIRYFLLIALTFAVCVPGFTARAEAVDWINGTIVGEKDEADTHYKLYGDCGYEVVSVEVSLGAYRPVTDCVFTAKSFRYAIIDGRLFIQAANDTAMRPLVDWGFASRNNVIPSPETDDFIFGSLIVRDLLQSTTLVTNTPSLHYVENIGSSYNIVRDENGNVGYTLQGTGVSRNGKWLVVNVKNIGLVKFNLATMGAIRIAPYSSQLTMLAISNDGNSVAESSDANHNQSVVYRADGCGESGATLQSTWYNASLLNPCQSRSLYSDINDVLGVDFSTTYDKPAFTDDGKLEFYTFGYGASEATKVTLRIANQDTIPRLDYLALGDSFSSGEGDLSRDQGTNLKFYRDHTDDDGTALVDGVISKVRPKEKCHISTNSYPYRLALGMEFGEPTINTTTTKWQSVACSGATAWDVKEQGSADYQGQNDGNKPRLEGYDVSNLKIQALNEFIPGRQKQIEFVKKYQPKVITLTMGGNDVNFGGKMSECVSWVTTCSYAEIGSRGKLKNEIYDQFDNLSSLYKELKRATGDKAKIYVLGYPIYVNADPRAKCSSKVLFLNLEEREMIVNSIIYLNNIIKAAAESAGVKYIDVENAFGSHRQCDNEEAHVNAVTGVKGYRGNEEQESFHPNKEGQADIAIAVWDRVGGQSLLDYVTCPQAPTQRVCPNTELTADRAAVPPYFQDAKEDDTVVRYYTLTNGTLIKSTSYYDVKTERYQFEPESAVDITLYSKPTHIGTYQAGGDGMLSASISIPTTISAGYHRLVLSGKSSQGRHVEVYQTVLILGVDPSDLDEDGVLDSQDGCLFGAVRDDVVDISTRSGCVGSELYSDPAKKAQPVSLISDKHTDDNSTNLMSKNNGNAIRIGINNETSDQIVENYSVTSMAENSANKTTQNDNGVILLILALALLIIAKYTRSRKA